MNHSAKAVAKWLAAIPGIENVQPVKVTSGRTVYPGALYTHVFSDGRRSLRFYLLGTPPGRRLAKDARMYAARRNLAFHLDDKASPALLRGAPEKAEWYVAGYWTGHGEEKFKIHHPFGPNFYLHAWDLKEAIDAYERRPYARKTLTLRRG